MSISCKCAAAVAAAVTTMTAAGAEPLVKQFVLNDLRSPEAIARWAVNTEAAPAEISFVPDGRLGQPGCAEVLWPGGATQPFIMLTGDTLPLKDWSDYDYLCMEVYNPDDAVQPFYMLATTPWAAGGAIAWSQETDAPGWDWSWQLFMEPGRSTLRIPVRDATRNLRDVQIFRIANETQKPTRFQLADVRLETADPQVLLTELLADLEAFQAKMTAAGPAAEALQPGVTRLLGDVARLREQLEQAKARGGWADEAESRNWRRAAGLARERLEDMEKRFPVVLFNAAVGQEIWGAWHYGWTHGSVKVFRHDEQPFAGEIGGTVKLELAANEGEGVQVVVRSRRPLRNVKLNAAPLRSADGAVIAPEQLSIAPVGYVNTIRPYYDVPFTGWYPDPICTFLDGFELPEETWQPILVDVRTAADQPAGLYRGNLTLTADGMKPIEIPFEVTVYDFAIPVKHHLPTAFSAGFEFFGPYFQTPEERERFLQYCADQCSLEDLQEGTPAYRAAVAYEKTIDLMLEHRMALDNIYSPFPPRLEWLKKLKANGIDRFSVLNYSGQFDPETGRLTPESKQKFFDDLDAILKKLEAAGLRDMAEVYGFDESQPRYFPALKEITDEIKAKYPDLPISTTAYDPTYGGDGNELTSIDIWCPLLPHFETNQANIQAARQRGKKIWWYICCNPKAPYPNWFVEYPTAQARLVMGAMPWKYDVEGFLYYAMMLWRDHWDATAPDGTPKRCGTTMARYMTTGPLTDFNGASLNVYSGDGELVYPGADGPVPTLRLKAIRDGLEDYEYLWLLREAAGQARNGAQNVPAGWLERAEQALTVPAAVVKNLREFDNSGDRLLAYRRQIAELLNEWKAAQQ